jgi:hypothetical protein
MSAGRGPSMPCWMAAACAVGRSSAGPMPAAKTECESRESNPHALRHWILGRLDGSNRLVRTKPVDQIVHGANE